MNTKVQSDSPVPSPIGVSSRNARKLGEALRDAVRKIQYVEVDSMGDVEGFEVDSDCVWAKAGVDYFPTQQVVKELPPGQYTVGETNRGICLTKNDVNLDDIIVLPDSASECVIQEIENFWSKEEVFRDLGFLWKRGVLMYGPPGSGKTSTVQIISKMIIDRGGITVYCTSPMLTAAGLALLRVIEPKRQLVVIVEDIDSIVDRYGEPELLALLDGQLQVDNVIFLATTNYPEKLDKRITNRPSRFDLVKEIGMPSSEARKMYLSTKNKRLATDEKELERWVSSSDGYSIAHLKELIISVECLGNTLDAALERINNMMDTRHTSSGPKQKIGITN